VRVTSFYTYPRRRRLWHSPLIQEDMTGHNNELMAVTVYRKGAEAVRERLEAQERTLAGQHRQIERLAALVAHCHAQATARLAQAFPLVVAKDLGASHVTGVDGDGQLVLLPLEHFLAMGT
jgi:hypothetical protein